MRNILSKKEENLMAFLPPQFITLVFRKPTSSILNLMAQENQKP